MTHRYRPESPLVTTSSLCRGCEGEPLCQACNKYMPGQLTPRHIINPPMHQGKCAHYRGRE